MKSCQSSLQRSYKTAATERKHSSSFISACDYRGFHAPLQRHSGFCKPFFKRYRPCYDVNLAPKLQVPEKAGSQYGFISSHAANSFAIAMIFGLWLNPRKYWLTGMLIWATLISYSRVYLAVHYTTDVLAGGITGVLFALICYKFAKVLEEKLILNQ